MQPLDEIDAAAVGQFDINPRQRKWPRCVNLPGLRQSAGEIDITLRNTRCDEHACQAFLHAVIVFHDQRRLQCELRRIVVQMRIVRKVFCVADFSAAL